MGNNHPLTCVIIVGTNEISWIPACLKSLNNSEYPNLQIIYVDNASTDYSVKYVKENYPKITIIESAKNLGFAGANNIGIKYAASKKCKYCFLINPDTKVSCNLISKLVDFMEKHLNYGIIGPMQTNYHAPSDLNSWSKQALINQEAHAFYRWDPQKRSCFINNKERARNTLEHAYVQGAAFFFRTDLILNAGLFEEIYHTYYEEVDLCRRVRWAGYKVALVLNLSIQHFGAGGSTGKSPYRNYHYSRNKYIYLITEPEYNFSEIFSLTTRWLKSDIKKAFAKKKTDITNLRQFLAITLWLLFKFPVLLKIRKKNRNLIFYNA